MMIRNGLKAFAGNFILVWKQLLFLVIVGLVCVGLFVLSSLPIVDRVAKSGWLDEFYAFIELCYTSPKLIPDGFSDLATSLYLVLFSNFGAIWGSYALSLFLILFLPNFLFYISEYVVGDLLNARMDSLLSMSFMNRLVSTLGRSTLYSLWKMLLALPFTLIMVVVCYGYGIVANSISGGWLLLPIFVGVLLLVNACKFTFFIGFLPETTNNKDCVIKCFARGLDQYSGGYIKKTIMIWGLFIMELAGVIFVSLFTIGAGFPIAFVAVVVLNIACSFVNYYATKKENFYVSETTIVKPL